MTLWHHGVAAAVGATLGLALWRATQAPASGNDQNGSAKDEQSCRAGCATSPPSETRDAWLHEVRSLYGDSAAEVIRRSFVIVVGLGGVGSQAATCLARCGVGKLRLIDFDQVTLSSLNRHAVACREDVGSPKVEVMKRRLAQIAPDVEVEAVTELYSEKQADSLLSGSPDFVVDAIDNIDTKLHLLMFCSKHNIRVISAMGAGAKGDPSCVQIADICDSQEDPLARATRQKLRRMYGIEKGISVVYSTEKPRAKLLPLDEKAEKSPADFATLPDFRVRILPVLGPLPAMFGNAISAYVISQLAGWPLEPIYNQSRPHIYHRVLTDIRAREAARYKFKYEAVRLDEADVAFLFETVWRGRSSLSGENSGRLIFARWDYSKPASLTNVVLFTVAEADKHDKISEENHPGGKEAAYPPAFLAYVQERLEMAQLLRARR